MWKVCGNIFEGCNVRQKLITQVYKIMSSGYIVIFTLVYAKPFKSIGMLAYSASFCYAVDIVCSDAFVN